MKLRWGILGCGDIVRKRVAGAILADASSELQAACRRDEAKLQAFCSEFNVARAYTCADDLIADADIDAVYVATPVALHLPQALAAAAAGKHVLVEKPMAMSVAECDEMISACRRHKVRLGVAYYRRFYPAVLRMKELLAEGTLGTPLSIAAVTSTLFPFEPGDDGYWRVLPEGGGGALMDVGSHRINLFLDLCGNIADVAAYCDTIAAGYEAEDCATALFRFAGGMHGILQCLFGCTVDPDEFWILGTKGRAYVKPLNEGKLVLEKEGEPHVEDLPPHENLHAPLVADFSRAVLENRDPTVTGEEGRLTNEVMARVYAAAGQSR